MVAIYRYDRESALLPRKAVLFAFLLASHDARALISVRLGVVIDHKRSKG
jgi:hypothetical protein